jgi:hypothetical protein
MNFTEVFDSLKGYAVKSVGSCAGSFTTRRGMRTERFVVIGSAGRDMLGTRTFKAAKFETIIRQVKKVYGPIPENAR